MATQSSAAGRENRRPTAASRGGGPGTRARALTSGAGPAAVTRGGGAAHLPGPAGDSFKRRAACAAARALAEPGPGLRFYPGAVLELLRGGQVRRARGASAWGVLLAAGARGVRTRVAPPASPRPRGSWPARRMPQPRPCAPPPPPPRPVPASSAHRSPPVSETPAPGPARPPAATPGPAVRGGEAAAGLGSLRNRRAPETPPARKTWTETRNGCGTGRLRRGAAGGGALNGVSP